MQKSFEYLDQIFDSIAIFDLSSLVYKYYFSGLKTTFVSPSNFVFYSITKDVINHKIKYQNSIVIIVLDHPKGSNSRRKILDVYKTGRKSKVEADVWEQMYIFKNFAKEMKITILCPENVEADDLIFHIARVTKINNVYLYTNDKDSFQIANHKTDKKYFIINNGEIKEMTCEFKNKFKIDINYIVEYFSIVGDSTDKIPGVYGLGQAFVVKYLPIYKNFLNIYLNRNKFKENLKIRIENGIENYKLSKRLFLPQIIEEKYLNSIFLLLNDYNIDDIILYLDSIGWGSLSKLIKNVK